MKKISLLTLLSFFFSVLVLGQQTKTEEEKTKQEQTQKEEEEKKQDTKNVMLNAESNTGPRVINIGLPGADISIFEDGLPVVPYFWPQNALTVWKYNQSIERINLASFSENTLIAGKSGFLIDSHSRQGGRKFRGFATARINTYGFFEGSANVSGPIKNNWFYSISTDYTTSPGIRKSDPVVGGSGSQSKVFIVKKFNNRKGELLFGAKYFENEANNNVNVPFIYEKNGDYSQVDGFDVLSDSYFPRDHMIVSKNRMDGSMNEVDMANSFNSKTIVYDFGFKYNFDNGWKLNFRNRFHDANVAMSTVKPIGGASINGSGIGLPPGVILTYADDGTPFDNPNQLVQMSAHSYNNPIDYTTFASRFELTKKIKDKHYYRAGVMYFMEDQDNFVTNNTIFLHEVAPNPRKVDAAIQLPPIMGGGIRQLTDNGVYNYPGSFAYIDGSRSDVGVYFSDNWEVSPLFTLGYGGRLNYRWYDAYSADSSKPLGRNETINDREKIHIDDKIAYWQAYLKGEYKLTKLTGLLFEFTKNEITPNLSQFSVASTTIDKRQPIYSGQMGVFYNHKKINIVSTLNYIKKVNSIKALTIYDPESGNGDNQNFKLYHDLQTIGWTTDIIAKPFKNFELHTMFTWQQPKYQGLNVEAYGIQHDFDGKVPIGLSEFLVEIDPSYSFAKRKVKLWASFRYFSKQYASLSNLLYYKPRWETFAGVDYKISKKFSAHVKMYNLLNYAGMKGGIQNATYYTEDNIEEVYNTYQSGQTMLRRHTELTLKYKF